MPIVDITTQSDADFICPFVLVDASKAPINLTGFALWMGVREKAADTDEPLRLSTATGEIVITDAPNGKFTVTISQARLARLPAGSYVHSLIRQSGAGPKIPCWTGTLTHTPGPSR